MADTIFMIHGMWGGAWYWENYRRYLESRGYRCVATTLPYHDMDPRGTPDPRLGTTGLLDYIAALEGEIAMLGAKPIILGHSMGGLLAQMLGARGLASSLVLLNPASPAGIVALTPSVVRAFWSVQTQWGFWRKPMRQTFDEAAYSMLHIVPEAERRAIYERFVYESGRAAFEIGYWLLDSQHATRVDAKQITCPILIATGAEDRITPVSVVRQVAKRYASRCTYKEFDRHAHWTVAEPGWEEIAGFVGDWLQAGKH
jgi:pimeloyl-ACP methyl ester carboxylesterase